MPATQNYEIGSEIDDVIKGMKYASLAITDDKPDTLKKVGYMNPWHIEALRMITGSEEEAHKPLSYILKEYMDLEIDTIIDESGISKGGHFLDTQGYIAHNDEVIVLAYRCTTSVFDWLTNFNTTSSEWEVEEDVAQGFSGYCSGLEGLCCGEGKPRVHTGFYNNFLSTVPAIDKYIRPLLTPQNLPRKLYVVGHSLGAGIATLAACYLLMEYDWNMIPHTLVGVTAGSPRTCLKAFSEIVQEELAKKDVNFLRIVRNKDVVATVPPAILGFHHLGRLVYITEDGEIQIDAPVSERDGDAERVKAAARRHGETVPLPPGASFDDAASHDSEKSAYEKKVARIPKAFRDHMPDFYLGPMKVYREYMFPKVELPVPKVGDENDKSNEDKDSEDSLDLTTSEMQKKKKIGFLRHLACRSKKDKEEVTEKRDDDAGEPATN